MSPARSAHAVAVLLVAVIVGAAAACSGQDERPSPSPTTPPTSAETATPADTPTPEPSPTATSAPAPTPTRFPPHYELPDLQTLPPEDWSVHGFGDDRQLRFTSSVVNLGTGPLIMLGALEADEGRVHATQRIRTTEDENEEREIGYFVYFGWHGHWHFEDFNLFELWTYDADGELDERLASNGKASWCITETALMDPLPDVYDEYAILGGCDAEMQALATGWIDTYESDLTGQSLDLRGIDDGRYAFVSTVNPDNLILELDPTNNTLTTYIEVQGQNVTVLDGP